MAHRRGDLKMRLITRISKSHSAEKSWYNTYSSGDWWDSNHSFVTGKTKRETHEALVGLGPTPSPEDVNRVIGNTSWTDCYCHDCGKSVEAVVELGQKPDYDSATANVCFPCLKKAVKLK
jgi:hypothetical protein